MRISAFIVTHNRLELLQRSLESVLAQTHQIDECIVVDDGSSDGTETYLNDFVDQNPNFIYLRNNTRKGASFSRNLAIKTARNDIITGLDDDDYWYSTRIEVFTKHFSPKWSFITARSIVHDVNKKYEIGHRRIVSYNDQKIWNRVGGQFMALKKRIIDVGGYDESLIAGQDYDLYLRLLKMYGSAFQIQEVVQVVDQEHGFPRTSDNPKLGYINCYFKHRSDLSVSERVCQIHRIKEVSNGCVPFRFIWLAPTFYMFIKMLKYYIEFHFRKKWMISQF